MTHDNPTDKPWHRRFTTQRALRGLEAVTHLSTAGAFILTVVLVSTGVASEANLVTAELLSTAGWTATGLLALAVATVTFAYLQRHRRRTPRAVAVGALLLAALGTADLAVNLWTLAQVGWPDSMLPRVWAPGAAVAGAAVVATGRREIATGLRAARDVTPAWSPSPQAVGAVVFAVVLVVSGAGPFAGLGGLAPMDHDGVASAAQGDEEWTVDFGGTVYPQPVIVDGTVYASGGGTTKAINQSTGNVEWSRSLGEVRSAVHVSGNTVYVGVYSDGTLYALDSSNGDTKWQSSVGSSNAVQSSPTVSDGMVFVGSQATDSMYAFDTSTGDKIWEYSAADQIRSSPVVGNGQVYFGSARGNRVYAVDKKSGNLTWDKNIINPFQDVTLSGGKIYVGANEAQSTSNKLYSLDADTGDIVWESQNDINISSSTTVKDGVVYAVNDGATRSDNKMNAFDAQTGEKLWSSSQDLTPYPSDPTVTENGVYVGSDTGGDSGRLRVFDPETGSLLWSDSTVGAYVQDPLVVDGVVYFGAYDGILRAVDTGNPGEFSSGSRIELKTDGYHDNSGVFGHPITGTVTDNGGDPVDGATVSTGTGVSTTTGADGSYELTVENTGTYDLTASTAIDEETQTVDVPDGGTTGVDFSLQSGTVAGVVEDQNGNPVSNATVTTLTYNTKDPNVDINLEELRDIVESPYPPQWENATNQPGVTTEELTVTRENSLQGAVDAADDWDSKRVLMHEPEQWELKGYDWPSNGTVALPRAEMLPPQVVVSADNRPVFSCWAPVGDGLLDGLGQNNVGSQLTNLKKSNCDEITVQRLDPTGAVSSTQTYSSTRTLRFQNGFEDITGLGEANYYNSARPNLEPGIYRVYPEDNSDAAMTYAIAPNADPEKIANNIVNVTNSEIDAKTSYLEEIQAQHDAGNIDIKTTTTNDRGEFSFDIDASVVEEVELRAAKSGTGLETELASGELNRQELATEFEDEIRGQFNTFEKSSVRFSEAEIGNQEFADVCRKMSSVADDLGAPYAGTGSTEVPNPDVTITGQRAPIPEGVSQPVRQCGLLNYAQQALQDPASLLPGLAGDIAEMAQDELEGHYENIVNLLQGNEDLQSVVEDELGRDLPEDPSELDRDEIETVIRDGLDTVDNPTDDIDVGEPDDSPLPDIPGGDDDSDAPSVDDPTEEIADRVNETITREWPITGVDDWEEAGLLIRIDYADGTSETLSRESEYVTLDESAVGPDTIRLEEYPFGEGDSAVANIRLDVSTPQGIGGEETPVRNPTFDGTIPGLDSIRLSDSAPGPSDAVTVGVTPAEQSQFGQLQTVNVTGPQCSRSIQASDGDATFTTCGQGVHRVAATFSNADGVQFTEVLSVNAGNAAQARDPLIRGAAGPTGRFAVAANGLESGRIDVTAGTSEVILTGIVPADADIPNRVKASTTGVDVARDATTTVRIRQGPNEQTIRDRIGVVLHTSAVGNESLLWRNGRPIRNPGDTASSSVEHFNDSTAIDTFTSDTATVRVEVDRDPSIFQEFRHSVQLRFAGIDIPFLSIQPTSWLTTLGSTGDGLPAPVQVGGGPLALLGGGVVAARRVGP
jgi:outer membrane protein assembly factor BamB